MMPDKNRVEISEMKAWQKEAFLYAIFYCCLSHGGLIVSRFNLSRICIVYDRYGDIFQIPEVGSIVSKLQHPMVTFHDDFKTNLRLLPKEYSNEVRILCFRLLSTNATPKDNDLKKIIEEELN